MVHCAIICLFLTQAVARKSVKHTYCRQLQWMQLLATVQELPLLAGIRGEEKEGIYHRFSLFICMYYFLTYSCKWPWLKVYTLDLPYATFGYYWWNWDSVPQTEWINGLVWLSRSSYLILAFWANFGPIWPNFCLLWTVLRRLFM